MIVEYDDVGTGITWYFCDDVTKGWVAQAQFEEDEPRRFLHHPADPRRNVVFNTYTQAQAFIGQELLRYTVDEIHDTLTISYDERQALRSQGEIAREKIKGAQRERAERNAQDERDKMGWGAW